MPILIEDGRGSGKTAGVNPENRLLTKSITSLAIEHATLNGLSYSIDVGVITLTSANESGILYIKNNNSNLVLEMNSIFFGIGKSNATGDCIVKIYSNPTTGTLISSGTTITPTNRNFGLSTPAQGTFLSGAEGRTITSGINATNIIIQSPNTFVMESSVILPTGYSMAFSITPPTGNTSMKISMFVRIFYFNEDYF